MRFCLIWFAIAMMSLLGCQPALQPGSVPTLPVSTPPAPTVVPQAAPTSAPTIAPIPTPALQSGLTFVATLGPTCAGPQREDQICTVPYQGEFVVTRPDGSEVARFQTDVDGRAVVDLSPGDYIVLAKFEAGQSQPSGGPIEVHVVAGQYAEVTFDLDTGMR